MRAVRRNRDFGRKSLFGQILIRFISHPAPLVRRNAASYAGELGITEKGVQLYSMREYRELRKTFAALKALREQQGLSSTDMEKRTGMDRAMISRLENGQIDNPTLATVSRYAKALGKRVIVSLESAVDA